MNLEAEFSGWELVGLAVQNNVKYSKLTCRTLCIPDAGHEHVCA